MFDYDNKIQIHVESRT